MTDSQRMTDAEFEALKADTVARAERGNRGELTPAERAQTRDDIGRVLAEARRRIDEWKTNALNQHLSSEEETP